MVRDVEMLIAHTFLYGVEACPAAPERLGVFMVRCSACYWYPAR